MCACSRKQHIHKRLRQLNRCLSAELNHCTVRLFDIDDILNIFRSQRFEIQLICNIKIRAYGFRIIIYNNCFPALTGICPRTMYRAKIEFDTLPDPYGA